MRKLVVLLAVAGLFGLVQPALAASGCCPGAKVDKEAKKEQVKKDCDDKAKAECADKSDKAEKKAEDCK